MKIRDKRDQNDLIDKESFLRPLGSLGNISYYLLYLAEHKGGIF